MLNIRKIFTLDVFDFSIVTKMLVSQSRDTAENIDSKFTPPLQTKIQSTSRDEVPRGKLSVRLARAWLKYWNCVDACKARIGTPGGDCPDCNPKTITTVPPNEPAFPCCSSCVGEKCVIATGNTSCIMGGDVNKDLLLIAQTLCYRDAYSAYLSELDCYECVNNARVNCRYRCSSPAGPEPNPSDVFEVLPEEEWNPDFRQAQQ